MLSVFSYAYLPTGYLDIQIRCPTKWLLLRAVPFFIPPNFLCLLLSGGSCSPRAQTQYDPFYHTALDSSVVFSMWPFVSASLTPCCTSVYLTLHSSSVLNSSCGRTVFYPFLLSPAPSWTPGTRSSHLLNEKLTNVTLHIDGMFLVHFCFFLKIAC